MVRCLCADDHRGRAYGTQGLRGTRSIADSATIQGWHFYQKMLHVTKELPNPAQQGSRNPMHDHSPGTGNVMAPMDSLNPTDDPKRAADRDLGPHNLDTGHHALRSEVLHGDSELTEVSEPQGQHESQGPDQEGWDLEYEWLQEVEREHDEVGPWADFV